MEPFDSERRSADLTGTNRLDQLRERSGMGGPVVPPARSIAPWIALALLFAFTLGLIANPWFEASVRSRLPGFAPTLAPTLADIAALRARVAALESRPAPPATLATMGAGTASPAQGERLARVEARVETMAALTPADRERTDKIAAGLAALTGRIDATSAATSAAVATATTTAERAQAMLVVAAARRQIEGGQRLGALEPALRRTLGSRDAPAVEAVAALGATPVTIASLRTGLERLRPALTGVALPASGPRGWWDGLRETLSGVVVHEGSSDPNAPSSRVDRATRALNGGNVAAAVAEIAALPSTPRAKAQAWLASAARLQAGMRGLAQLDLLLLEAPALPSASPA